MAKSARLSADHTKFPRAETSSPFEAVSSPLNPIGARTRGDRFVDTHDGGVAVKFVVNDKEICSSDAVYGGNDSTLKVDGKDWSTLARMTECPGPFHLNKGDQVKVVTTYDTVKYPM